MSFNFLRSIGGSIDLMRIGGASALIIYPAPYLFVAFAKDLIPEPAAFGTGYALVIAAVAGAIGGKELAISKAKAITSDAQV